MESIPKYNIIVLGVSCFDGMASSTRVQNLLKPLIRKPSITVSNLIYDGDKNGLEFTKGLIDEVKYLIIGFNIRNIISFFSFYFQGLKFIRENRSFSKKNIIYNYHYVDIKNILFLIYARMIGYKIILDIVEDNIYYTKFPSIANRLKIRSTLLLLKLTPFIAHSVITISTHLQDLMLSICKRRIPVLLMPISVDLNRFKNKMHHITNTHKVFYGGSFGEKDGINFLIDAFSQVALKHQNVELILTGRASDSDFKKLLSYIDQSPCKNKINYRGFLTSDDYYKALNDCDIFCMTRVNSNFANAGFPFKLGEFLSTGKAVIATNIGEISKYLKNHKNALLIEPESVLDIVNSLSYIIENPEMISQLGQEARKVAESHFDSEILSKELLQVFEKS